MPLSLTVIILTFDEELHLERCLKSIAPLGARVVVVDSGSRDRTQDLARAAGAEVFEHPFVNQAAQFNWALDNTDTRSDWIMRLDADEVLEPELVDEILAKLPGMAADVTGINLKRRHVFLGRWIRHGGRYPVTLLRIWRRGRGRVEDRWMDEHVIVDGGRTETFKGDFSDWNLKDLTFFTDKHNKYATREAVEIINQRHGLFARDNGMSAESASKQAAFKRWAKESVYNRLPFWLGPFGYFMMRMTIQGGFLDGRQGLIYHFLQGFWYRFLVGAKVLEFERALVVADGIAAKRAMLGELTGLKL